MTTTESTLPPLVAAKLRRLLGVEPTDPVPDRITPRQVVTLHHGERVTPANKIAWNESKDIQAALIASGIVETETKIVVIDTDLFRPIPLTTIGSTEWRAEFPRPDPATETATHTVVTRAALTEWWPSLGIEPGPMLAAWMRGGATNPEVITDKPTTAPKPTTCNKPKVGWQKSVDAEWDNLLRLHKGKPTVEQLVKHLEKNDSEGYIVPSGIADELAWKTVKGGKTKHVRMRTIEDYIGALPKSPRT